MSLTTDVDTFRELNLAFGAADSERALQPDQIAFFHQSGWMKMLAPRDAGGLEYPLPTVVRFQEDLARVDGSSAWVITLCAGAGWFAGFMPKEIARSMLSTAKICIAGSGAPSGFADRVPGGWRLSGLWNHASGSQLATHFTVNAQLRSSGRSITEVDGRPAIRSFIVPAQDVSVKMNSWDSLGLRATTSYAISMDNKAVEEDYAFHASSETAVAEGPLYLFPFNAFALVTLAACVAGMASNFVDLAGPLVNRPISHLRGPSNLSQETWRHGHETLQSSRAAFYQGLDFMWDELSARRYVDRTKVLRLENAAYELASTARQAVDAIFPACGLKAANMHSDINRVWRDIHTASQHSIWLR